MEKRTRDHDITPFFPFPCAKLVKRIFLCAQNFHLPGTGGLAGYKLLLLLAPVAIMSIHSCLNPQSGPCWGRDGCPPPAPFHLERTWQYNSALKVYIHLHNEQLDVLEKLAAEKSPN